MNKVDMGRFFCASPRCLEQTTGIYCDKHKKPAEARPTVYAGERVAFLYRGTLKQGVVESVARVKAIVLIEVGTGSKRKQKLVEVRLDKLMGIVPVEEK